MHASVPLTRQAIASQDRRRDRWAWLAWVTLLFVSLPWDSPVRVVGATPVQGTSYLDLVKLTLLAVAVIVAWRHRVPTPTEVKLLVAYGVFAGIGALVISESILGAFRSVRYVATLLAAAWLAAVLPRALLIRGLAFVAVSISGLALIGAQIGISDLSSDRLFGLLPPLHPNALALVAVVGVAAVLSCRIADNSGIATGGVLGAIVMLITVFLTGSRSSLIAVGILIVTLTTLVLVHSKSPRMVILGWLTAGSIAALAIFDSSTGWSHLDALLTRSGTATLDPSLTGRTVIWEDAIASHENVASAILGQGLQAKTMMRSIGDSFIYQGIDNSWISIWISGGLIGLILIALAITITVARGIFLRDPLMIGLAAIAVVNGVTESYLADVSILIVALVGSAAAAQNTDLRRSQKLASNLRASS